MKNIKLIKEYYKGLSKQGKLIFTFAGVVAVILILELL